MRPDEGPLGGKIRKDRVRHEKALCAAKGGELEAAVSADDAEGAGAAVEWAVSGADVAIKKLENVSRECGYVRWQLVRMISLYSTCGLIMNLV